MTGQGMVESAPSPRALAEGVALPNEASVGMIARDRLARLLAAGMDDAAARDLVASGSLRLGDDIAPQSLRTRGVRMIADAKSGGMSAACRP